MPADNTSFLAKEGTTKIIVVSVFALLVLFFTHFILLKFLSLLALVGIIILYRNPERSYIRSDAKSAVIAPCDGTIVNIESFNCSGVLQGECFKITIKKRFFDVSMLRAPIEAPACVLDSKKGIQLAAKDTARYHLNEQAKVAFEQEERKVVLKLFLYPFAQTIRFFKQEKALNITQRFGFFSHGEVHLFLPENCRIALKPDSQIFAGETVIGYFS